MSKVLADVEKEKESLVAKYNKIVKFHNILHDTKQQTKKIIGKNDSANSDILAHLMQQRVMISVALKI